MSRHLHHLALCAAVVTATEGGFEVPLSWSPSTGLFNAEIAVGTPLQKLRVAVESGSATLWVSHFDPSSSSSYKSDGSHVRLPPYADGLEVDGISAHEAVQLGAVQLEDAPLLVVQGSNASTRKVLLGEQRADGILGLACPHLQAERVKEEVEGFFCHFWRKQAAELPRTYKLSLGEAAPKMQLGMPLKESPSSEGGGTHFAANIFSSQTSLWYTTLRGMSLLTPGGPSFFSPPRSVSFDFNSALPTGVAALLDSGSPDLRVGTGLFNVFQAVLPGDCRRSAERSQASLVCDCKGVEEFPTITFSFEASGNVRFMGLDFGADFLTCMPPTSYVTKKPKEDTCSIAIVDGGKQHTKFGVDAFVLGVPFFRSTTVAYDAQRREVAIGPQTPPEGSGTKGLACVCTDPKNWWNTGKRLSGRRIGLCLGLVAGLAVYVFLMHSPSPSADAARGTLGILFARANTVRHAVRGRGGARLGGLEGAQLSANLTGGDVDGDDSHSRGDVGRSRRSAPAVPLQDDDVQSSFVPLHSDAEG